MDDTALAVSNDALAKEFPSPFANQPHPLACLAAVDLQRRLQLVLPDGVAMPGKMFGVLVVRHDHQLFYLSAFSGLGDVFMTGTESTHGSPSLSSMMTCFAPCIPDPSKAEDLLSQSDEKIRRLTTQMSETTRLLSTHTASPQQMRRQLSYETEHRRLKQRQLQNKKSRAQRREQLADRSSTEARAELHALSRLSQEDKTELKQLRRDWQSEQEQLVKPLKSLQQKLAGLTERRRQVSAETQMQLFELYRLKNAAGVEQSITDICLDTLPPSGSGDCAAPKLLQLCFTLGLQPLALAEFWWGEPSREGVRHHRQFYPSCRGKCGPILPFMLMGLNVASNDWGDTSHLQLPAAIYEDEYLAVFDKPAGLLSVPGKAIKDSVQARLAQLWPSATGPLLVHRLDMDTSGLLLAAKSPQVHKHLQKLFLSRNISKTYEAILVGDLMQGNATANKEPIAGRIELPLRVDLDDRPRQQVCYTYGKAAVTKWRLLDTWKTPGGVIKSRVELYPLTGRTHQLRLHAAHATGLSCPIENDPLYGQIPSVPIDSQTNVTQHSQERDQKKDPIQEQKKGRMKLHASRLQFIHPVSLKPMDVRSPVPF